MRWKRLDGIPKSFCSNLVAFRGRFYAVFRKEIVVIDPYSLDVTLLLHSPQISLNYLVPSGNDELFLVERFPVGGVFKISHVHCRVSRLDEEVGKCVEGTDLGDRILLIGGQLGMFSCSAKELPHGCGLSGNSILFTNLPCNATVLYKYGVHTGNAEDNLNCWRTSRVNRLMKLKAYFPVLALRVERLAV